MKLIEETWKTGTAYEVLLWPTRPRQHCPPAARTWTA